MSLAGEFKRRLDVLFHRDRFQRELEEEMRLHKDLRRQQQLAAGLSDEAARRAANRRFGNATLLREKSSTAWGWDGLTSFSQDAAYGLRSMWRTPAITIVALISLALGIGANTAIFSFLDAVMLRSLPVKEPQQLVKLGVEDWDGITDSFACTELYSYPFYRQLQSKNEVFSDTAAIMSLLNTVHGFVDDHQQSEKLQVQTISGTYFQMLGVGAQVGRVLNQADDSGDGEHPVVVLSDGFWKRRFGADRGILNHTVRLGPVQYKIVGVAAPEFFGTAVGQAPDMWAPLSMGQLIPPNWVHPKENFSESLYILGRLKPGVTMQQAEANINVLFPQIIRSFPDARLTQANLDHLAHAHVQLQSMERGMADLRRNESKPLKILMTIVALVLLIACANIANLLLARSTARARELAVRQALGARRSRIIRQLLTESLILALTGGALGIAFAAMAKRVLLRMISDGPDVMPLDVSLNLRLLAFTFAITVCTALLFGTLPALRATRMQLTDSLKSNRGPSFAARTPLAKCLVVTQVALSLVLMVGACLFLRTLVNLANVNPGFNKENVLRLNIDSDITGYKDDDPRLKAIFHEIEDRVSTLPGVQAASFSSFVFREGTWNSGIRAQGMPVDHKVNVQHNIVGNGFFNVMGIPLVAGRNFGPQDTKTSQPVAIISEKMARKLFPPGSPIGRTYLIGDEDGAEPPLQLQVIGVVKDVLAGNLKKPAGYIDYMPYTQRSWGFGDFEVRYTGDFSAISNSVQQTIHAVDPRLPISDVKTLEQQVARAYSGEAMIAELSAFFALVAVFLACIGLYGLMSYLVGRRTGEIGIRMALGADRARVGWQVMREISLLVVLGIVIGLPVTFLGMRSFQAMLFGLKGTDPFSLSAATALLLAAGLAAGYLPARRAANVNPMVALRDE
ncbi:ABC transporter permease [Acidobacteria bacterium AB60]|nr:ABC transporter permease [Acidobacteria bacterium AB60]